MHDFSFPLLKLNWNIFLVLISIRWKLLGNFDLIYSSLPSFKLKMYITSLIALSKKAPFDSIAISIKYFVLWDKSYTLTYNLVVLAFKLYSWNNRTLLLINTV